VNRPVPELVLPSRVSGEFFRTHELEVVRPGLPFHFPSPCRSTLEACLLGDRLVSGIVCGFDARGTPRPNAEQTGQQFYGRPATHAPVRARHRICFDALRVFVTSLCRIGFVQRQTDFRLHIRLWRNRSENLFGRFFRQNTVTNLCRNLEFLRFAANLMASAASPDNTTFSNLESSDRSRLQRREICGTRPGTGGSNPSLRHPSFPHAAD